MPDLLALSSDRETQEAAQRHRRRCCGTTSNFEREFYMIPRDTYKTHSGGARRSTTVPFDRWRELGADGVVIGTVQKVATGIRVEMRLYNVRARQSSLGREYTGSAANPRLYAHTMSDEIHESQRKLRGVARTKLTFSSDRNREAVLATVEKRDVKEIYVADYDGANPRRITINRTLNMLPNWSPDGRSIAYTSYRTRRARHPDLEHLSPARWRTPTKGVGQNWLPVFSPDGTRIAFMSNRDGNSRDLRDEPRRLEPAPADQQSGDRLDADLVADRHADRLHVGAHRHAADLRDRRRRLGPAPHLVRVVCRSRRRGRRRRTTRSRSRRAPGPASTSRS